MKADHYHSNHKFTALLTTLIVLIGLCIFSVFLLFNINWEFTPDTLPVINNAEDHEQTGLSNAIASGDAPILTDHHSQWEAQVNQAPALPKDTASQKLFFASSAHLKTTSPIYRQVQNIFKGVAPLHSRLRRGERFSVIYDQAGRILLATVTLHRHTVEAVRFTDSSGYTGYYTPTGQALFKSLFLTTPVNYTRISDRFTLHRWHPILHITRPHYGIDYAAPTGTPIHAISSGRVSYTGWNGGYGNTVIINHGSRYQSLYAHIRRHSYTVKSGQWVKQGQIIGYVGSTGLATGPHLHFGLYEYGRAINPDLVLPKSNPPTRLAQNDLQDFLTQTNRLLTKLALAENHYMV